VRKLLILVVALIMPAVLTAQSKPAELTPLRSGIAEIDTGWAEHEGDEMSWALSDFDDTAWKTVDLEDQKPARTGWRWFRKHVKVGADHRDMSLLIEGGDGTYEVYVNGQQLHEARIHSAFDVRRPVERVFALNNSEGEFTIALRTHAPANYIQYHFPLFVQLTLGDSASIRYERRALASLRLFAVAPAVAINLLIVLAGLGMLGLYASQRSEWEYLYLALYLLLLGLSDGLWLLQQAGVLSTPFDYLLADPLTYVYTIAQIEFTFSFARRRVGRVWRVYEGLLLTFLPLPFACWWGIIPSDIYLLLQAVVTVPVALALPVSLLSWYRRGNREAGWLILPSLLPAATLALFDTGTASTFFGWRRFEFLDDPILLGPFPVNITDAGSLLFLLAIGIVMLLRFTRVSREQARATADLEAAREVQRRLVPPATSIAGLSIESEYIPAQQVGGDFFHIRTDLKGGLLAVIGDVSGKGLPAAMNVSAIMGALRAMPELSPKEVLRNLNRDLAGNLRDGFATCCAVHIDPKGATTIANAGHLPPYHNGSELNLDFSPPLGIVLGAEYEETMLRLESGDMLTLLSDGIVEARSAKGELFGFERTAAISTKSAREIAQTAQLFGQEDDITVLTLSLSPLHNPSAAVRVS
jgi:phosphoserine phosphatase RsbU/P